jgi:hypothetical protein
VESILLAAHVLAGILFVGPVAVTTSLFPRFAPIIGEAGERDARRDPAVAAALLRIIRVYGALALIVPVVGLVLALVQGRLGEIWITVAMVLTAIAGALLILRIVPAQRDALAAPDDGRRLRTIGMLTGVFNVLWAAVVVLMIVRPGAE